MGCGVWGVGWSVEGRGEGERADGIRSRELIWCAEGRREEEEELRVAEAESARGRTHCHADKRDGPDGDGGEHAQHELKHDDGLQTHTHTHARTQTHTHTHPER